MIRYEQFLELRRLLDEEHCTASRVANVLSLNIKTVLKWASQPVYPVRRKRPRPSCLDPYKADLVRLLHQHPYSAQQLLQHIRRQGYSGGYSILKEFVRQVRPKANKAYLTLHFPPGECVQIDWGYAGSFMIGQTRRRLSFLVLVLGYSRRMYVEFTLSETLEQFLSVQQNAFLRWGGAPQRLIIDNLKTAVLSHPRGQPAVYNPHYLDFARHYGCELRACNVRAAHEKGRVENAVGYVKKNFLNGLSLTGSLAGLNASVWQWLDEVADVRIHGETKRRPIDLFAEEKQKLLPLPGMLYDVGQPRCVHTTRRCRIHFDANRYSVPPVYAGTRVNLVVYPDRLLIYHRNNLVAEHPRCYGRQQNIVNPDHEKALLAQRPRAREQGVLQRFFRLCPEAEIYYQQLQQRRVNAMHHVKKIVALCDIHGDEAVARILLDTHEQQAYSSEYVANLIEQRARFQIPPGPLHVTRGQDLLELNLPEPNLDCYQPKEIS